MKLRFIVFASVKGWGRTARRTRGFCVRRKRRECGVAELFVLQTAAKAVVSSDFSIRLKRCPDINQRCLLRIQHNLAEHLTFLHVLVRGSRFFQRECPVHNRLERSAEDVLQDFVQFAHGPHV
jgi:hypothetical protein